MMNHSRELAAKGSLACVVAAPTQLPVKIYDKIMVPYQTPVRRYLSEWATTIRDRFFYARDQTRLDLVTGAGLIVNCFNEAALIEACFGREEVAAALCAYCLQWLERHARRPDTLVILQYAFEPFLNLARLDRMKQRYEDALQKIEIVDKVARGQEAWLGDLFIPASLCQEIFSRTTPLPRLIRTTYILEWVKALVICKRYREAVAFNPPWHSAADLTARDIIWEGKIIAFCCSGHYDEALAAGSPALSEHDGMNRSLFLFRRAETYAVAGRTEDALRVAGNLARGFLSYPGSLSMTRLGLLVRLTAFLGTMGAADAPRLAELGFKRAAALGDILFQSEFLNLMADLQSTNDAALRLEASNLRRNGLYGMGRNNFHKSAGSVEVLTADLLHFAQED